MKKLLMIFSLLMVAFLTTGCIYIAPGVGTIQGIVISSQDNVRTIKEKETQIILSSFTIAAPKGPPIP